MRTDYDERICFHIDVPDVQPDGAAALFDFMCKHVQRDQAEPVDSNVKIWIPRAVLQSWANVLPRIVADLAEFERQAKAQAPKPS